MLSKAALFWKWAQYGLLSVLGILLQGLVLQKIQFWGVIPFLYPVLVAAVACYEGPFAGTVHGLVLGVVCDLLLPAALPCLYTLIFPLAGLTSALIARILKSTGFLSMVTVLVASSASFLLTGFFTCLVFSLQGRNIWLAGLGLAFRELFATAIFMVPVALAFRAIHYRIH